MIHACFKRENRMFNALLFIFLSSSNMLLAKSDIVRLVLELAYSQAPSIKLDHMSVSFIY